jgi:mono/diheme cytochrome c family protein/predicted  nucleic acid-binding Zn-ribbon protein
LDRQAVVTDLEAELAAIDQTQLATVDQEVAAEQQRLADAGGEIDELDDQIVALDKKIFAEDARMRATKSVLDAQKYEYDAALQSGDEGAIESEKQTVDELTSRWDQETRVVQDLLGQRDDARAELAEKRSALSASEARLAELRSAVTALETRRGALDKDLAYFALNAPLLDFLQPTLKIEQVMLSGLYHDINFATIDRVDRCMTCHQASNRDGYDGEQWVEPYRSHPRLDLFVSDGSPHPYNDFGCTVCHSGLDRATDFARAGHSPVDEEQKHHWEDTQGWKKQKYLETPIFPKPLSESGCLTCHADQVWLPESNVVDQGRKLVTRMGCYGCHVVDYEAFRDMPKAGPDLRRVASKTDDAWAAKWIEAPRDFRQTTWMPHFFFEENIEGEANEAFQRAELESIVEYLWDSSEKVSFSGGGGGSADRGQQLFESVGCTGCHVIDAESPREAFFDSIERLHGPNLVGVGSKVSEQWLFAWLKNPREYRPDTSMPNLRLSDQEAADLVAYLMQQRKPEWEGLTRHDPEAEARATLIKKYLQSTMTIEQSEARVAEMGDEEQALYLGRQSIAKYGCAGCHTIAGFEDSKPIGVELSEEASKPLHLFDFGHVHEVQHTKHDWIRTKLMRPRIWDEGKQLVKTYEELYRMPNFGMSELEANAVTSLVMGFTKESVRAERKAGDPTTGPALAAGRKLVTRYNCQGCHIVEGGGQTIRAAMADDTNLPPSLASQGGRTQADWLFGFLHDPSSVQLRPWLSVRMPTFEFDDDEVNTVLSYFASLDGTTAFESDPPPPSAMGVAVGGEIFGMLQCARCHPAGPEALAALGGGDAELAPSLLLAQERLRHEWVPGWIKDPQKLVPGTKMPTNFPFQNGDYMSPLPMAIDQPTFVDQKRNLMRHFDSEEDLKEFLGDVDAVSAALRDYLWSL